MPDAAPPVNRYRRSLSRSNNNSAVLAIVYILSTLQQWFPCGPLLARHLTRLIRAFSFRVHDRGFWPKPPKVVWSLLLQADSEGPTLISQTVAHLLSLSAVCCARGTLKSVNRTTAHQLRLISTTFDHIVFATEQMDVCAAGPTVETKVRPGVNVSSR